MKTAVLAALIAFPVLADPDVSIRSRAPDIDVNELADKVGEIAARTLRETSDIDVTGEVVRVQEGFRVTLELRENGKLGATASAAASTPEEVIDASASAAVDLFRAWKETSALSMNPSPVPEPPGPSAALQPGIVKLDLDADLMVAFDEARTADAQGTDKPEDAAAAWRAVAESIGPNPFREAAAERAKAWQTWAENKRAFEEQRSKDTSRMRKVLPLEAVTDETKIELLVRYTRAYGVDRAGALISFMPSPLRLRGNLAVGCEAQQARKCVELASMSTDPAQAADYLGQACNAGDANACADAGERWLSEETRDVTKALSALESGCAGGSARACTRLARVYEEGDGTDVDLARASEIRDRACSAGDGLSCRKLACNAADAQAANELWSKGCKDGDSVSCTLANATKPQPAPVPVQPETKPVRRPGAGSALLGFAVVAGTGAAFLALTEQGDNNERAYWRPHALTMAGGGTRSAASSPRVLPIALGATAAVAAVAGVTLLVWQPDPGPGKVAVGVTPSGVMLSGNLP